MVRHDDEVGDDYDGGGSECAVRFKIVTLAVVARL